MRILNQDFKVDYKCITFLVFFKNIIMALKNKIKIIVKNALNV